LKGKYNVVDDRNFTGNPVAAGICNQLHDGRLYPSFAGTCRYRNTGQPHSGTQSHVISGIPEVKSTITRLNASPLGEHITAYRRKPVFMHSGGTTLQIQAFSGMRDGLRKNPRTFPLPPIVGAIALAS
jgi:hypothetical protein